MDIDNLDDMQHTLEETVVSIVSFQRLLWTTPGKSPAKAAAGLLTGGARLILSGCPEAPADRLKIVAAAWAEHARQTGVPEWTFSRICDSILSPRLNAGDIRYYAMRAIRLYHRVPFSFQTAHVIHELAGGMGSFVAAGREGVSIRELLDALGAGRNHDDSDEPRGLPELFLECCLVLGLLEEAGEDRIRARAASTDAEYILNHLFAVPTGIAGLDTLLGGGGLMLTDGPAAAAERVPGTSIGGRVVLCIGPFGSGKSLLTLRTAVEVARKGGAAWVMALEQTEAECLYALEAIGISATRPPFDLVYENTASALDAFANRSPTRGALVFLRPEAHGKAPNHGAPPDAAAPGYISFLTETEKRLSWMRHYPLRLLAIDPVNAFDVTDKRAQMRAAARHLFEAAKEANVNVWLTSEKTPASSREPNRFEENIADTVIHLDFDTTFDQRRRYVEITKSRFQRERSGRHALQIDSQHGVQVFPSSAVVAQIAAARAEEAQQTPIPVAVEGLERLLGTAAIRPGDLLALAGPGKAKTLLGMRYLIGSPPESEEICPVFISDYSLNRMARFVESIADDSLRNVARRVRTISLPTGYVEPGLILERIRAGLEEYRRSARRLRVLVTNLARWEEEMPFITHDPGFGMALISLLRNYDAASVVVTGDSVERGSRLRDAIFDQADFLLHFLQQSVQGRTITLVRAQKTRLMRHQRELFELTVDSNEVRIRPAPLFRIGANGDAKPIKITLYLHAETDVHKWNHGLFSEALEACVSPVVAIEKQSRRFDLGLLTMAEFSAVDELQVFQVDEFQLPNSPATKAPESVFFPFDFAIDGGILEGRLENLRARVFCQDRRTFLAVPYYVNISFLARRLGHLQQACERFGQSEIPKTWREMAALCSAWDQVNPDELFFSCSPQREIKAETYNSMYLEILSSLKWPDEEDYKDIARWLSREEAADAAYLLWQTCHRSHMMTRDPKGRMSGIVVRHWYNTLNQEFSGLTPEKRAEFEVVALPGNVTTAGEWYLAVPSHSAAPDVALRIIRQITQPERETVRVEVGAGLPTREVYYTSPESRDASVSRYFRFKRDEVHSLLRNAIRRSQFRLYQRYSSTIYSHLQWILEIPRPKTRSPKKAEKDVRAEIARAMGSLVSNIHFLRDSIDAGGDSVGAPRRGSAKIAPRS